MGKQTRKDKILIADDAEILNNMMKGFFEENDFDVVQAFDGEECQEVFLKEKPDVVFVDLQMPKVPGIEALKFIKQHSPRTIVVLMTAWGSEQMAVPAMKMGADECLNKPFQLKNLAVFARNLLENRRTGEKIATLETRIQRQQKYLAHVTKIINEALITTDATGRIQFINYAASKLWGYSRKELKDQDINFLIRGEAETLLYRDIVKDTVEQDGLEGEFHFRKKDNTTFPGYLSTSVIRENKQIGGIVVVVADLTRLYEVKRKLKQSHKLASLGMVVEGVAHEVRNCVTSLGGFSRRLRDAFAENQPAQQYTRIILDDVDRLEKMVRDIEDYVRFSKFYSFRFIKIDLEEVIRQARERTLHQVTPDCRNAVTFVFKADKNLPAVSADPQALEEAFYHLILNAYEAMPQGGKLKVTARNLSSAVAVSFTDTGVGIESADAVDIFTPFFTSKTRGAGMGLSKVHLLIEEHGGTVHLKDSAPGKGTTFEVRLPVERLMAGSFPWEVAVHGRP